MSERRYCRGKFYEKRKETIFEKGVFHQFGNDYEEFESGPGNYTVAIVELPDGRIIMPLASDIQFLDSFEKENITDETFNERSLAVKYDSEYSILSVYSDDLKSGKPTLRVIVGKEAKEMYNKLIGRKN